MAFLQARDEAAVKKEFERIGGPVKLIVFATELGGDSNTQAVALIREVAALSDQLSVTVLNPHIDRDQAAAYGITESPAVVVEGAQDYGIRFLGIPPATSSPTSSIPSSRCRAARRSSRTRRRRLSPG
jgi:Alkyl hydroperoxide reductase, large subunit